MPRSGAEQGAAHWHPATRVAFRFCFLYFGLFIVVGQMLTSLLFAATNDGGAFEVDYTRPVQATIVWVGAHVFGIAHPVSTALSGSGDRMFDWIELACVAFLAVVGTAVWSVWDWRRTAYPGLFRWAHVIARFALAATLLSYGAAKVVPLQMSYPSLLRMLEPYGHFSPMGVLWASIGAAPAYEIFAGAAEFGAGLLLMFPRTAMLGALLALADGVQVFMLNMTYDVPVKILSFHLIPLALFVLAPDARRLLTTMFTEQAAAPSADRRLFRTARAHRWSLVGQAVFAVYLIVFNLLPSIQAYSVYGPGRPHSPLYGIWNVTSYTSDGVARPPLTSDATRPRWVVFDNPGAMYLVNMDDGRSGYENTLDMQAHTMALKAGSKSGQLTFATTGSDGMSLTGTLDGHAIAATLQRMDLGKLLLPTRGFHWVQDRPFNR